MTAATPSAVLLDRQGDGNPPSAYLVVESEAQFLNTALSGRPLLVRGEALCRWAETFLRGRGTAYREIESPVAALRRACPALTVAQATELKAALGTNLDRISESLTVRGILQAVYPSGPWDLHPSRAHAARWLLWLADQLVAPYVSPLVTLQAERWASECDAAEEGLYGASNREAACRLLNDWLGLGEGADALMRELGPFPVDVPDNLLRQVRERWSVEIQQSGGASYERISARPIPSRLAEVIAEEAYGYYSRHTEAVSLQVIQSLELALPASYGSRLRNLVPPEDPGAVPSSRIEILAWFLECYLPFRQWQAEHGGDSARKRVTELAREFAEWYLAAYPVALHGGDGHAELTFTLSGNLQSGAAEGVTLWVILDGMHYPDSQLLARALQQSSLRLSVEAHRAALAPLPTITMFCKPALQSGAPPAVAIADRGTSLSSVQSIPRNQDPAERMRTAVPGDVYVWSVLEPDSTYHTQADRPSVVAAARGQLIRLADQIAGAMLAVPDGMPLRCVITTDHGRLLGPSVRALEPPDGMVAHGRAAWGSSAKIFDQSGVALEGDVAYLQAQRFQLPDDCAIILGDASFITADGRRGTELFTHGGCYPEEVIVPWVELVRDRTKPRAVCRLTGAGRAGSPGELNLHLENAGDIPLALVSLSLRFGDAPPKRAGLAGTAAPRSSLDAPVPVDSWPTKAQASRASALVTLEQQSGARWEFQATVTIESEEMYAREDILGDLLGDL